MRSRRMYIVVVYDVCETDGDPKQKRKNRRRLYKKLKDVGSPVQFSAFEFNVTPEQKSQIISIINRYIEPSDRVSLYTLCEECRRKIERFQTKTLKPVITDEISSMEV
ncbi:MAG: CRISPR-associated endonuclease Cas2 [Deltaproteobacteria bacterium]|nr:CRISPR-associated endonuclease Cas2 [Deltaproteobacteria bacterium]